MDLNAARGAELWEGTARLSGAVPYVGDERFGWRVMRVLVVEDEMPLADAIARGL